MGKGWFFLYLWLKYLFYKKLKYLYIIIDINVINTNCCYDKSKNEYSRNINIFSMIMIHVLKKLNISIIMNQNFIKTNYFKLPVHILINIIYFVKLVRPCCLWATVCSWLLETVTIILTRFLMPVCHDDWQRKELCQVRESSE